MKLSPHSKQQLKLEQQAAQQQQQQRAMQQQQQQQMALQPLPHTKSDFGPMALQPNGKGGRRRMPITWQVPEDRGARVSMMHQIVRLLRTKKPNAPQEWLQKLPDMARVQYTYKNPFLNSPVRF